GGRGGGPALRRGRARADRLPAAPGRCGRRAGRAGHRGAAGGSRRGGARRMAGARAGLRGRRGGAGRPPGPAGATPGGAGRLAAAAARGGGARGAVMTEPQVFEYAVLRVIPRVDRGEAMNAGVLLYCRPLRYLGARIALDAELLLALDPAADVAGV